jgi:hypothetical protein
VKTKHEFVAELKYEFNSNQISDCQKCGKAYDTHLSGQCLFEASQIQMHALYDFFQTLMKDGGELVITTKTHQLHQRIDVRTVDKHSSRLSTELVAVGTVFLEEF